MSPSLFSNEHSRGPLYRYWKEQGEEEKSLRDQRIQEARLRSKGILPINPTFGPSSNDQYTSRATSGPPAYRPDETTETSTGSTTDDAPRSRGRGPPSDPDAEPRPQSHPRTEPLPSYDTATATGSAAAAAGPREQQSSSPSTHLYPSAEEEKARLRDLEDQKRQMADDAAIAQTLSGDQDVEVDADAQIRSLSDEPVQDRGKGGQPERRKSAAGKIGRWLADAASGYTKKQERW
ncbi:hypothetical protein A1O3_09044 [Capronia epimyces CBS 606.96]|uniref:Uncharacterized protein n=1 Tax=Capronia epimyces CBS 606.96 TaxID=1182542 RepID=W9XKP9_9EURO|nr:uncharacterized protein A1O3_09044 [Capronia epimyces CBS 606.96]EXJ77885.1 hypothetical protein A1O3_09044 [Capronia epimyces CBS 606.96]